MITLEVRIVRVEAMVRGDHGLRALSPTPVLRTRCAEPANSKVSRLPRASQCFVITAQPVFYCPHRSRAFAGNVAFTKGFQGFAITV